MCIFIQFIHDFWWFIWYIWSISGGFSMISKLRKIGPAEQRDGASDQHADANDHENDLSQAFRQFGQTKGEERWGTIQKNLVMSVMLCLFFLNMFWIYLKTSFWVALAIVVQTCFTHNICGICRDFWAQRINKTVCDSTSTTWQWLIHPHNTVLSWNLLTLLSWTRQNPMAAFSPKTFWPPESFFGMPCSPVRRRNWKSFIKLCHTLSTDRPNPSSRKTSEHVPVAAINSNSLFISSWKMVESARSGC